MIVRYSLIAEREDLVQKAGESTVVTAQNIRESAITNGFKKLIGIDETIWFLIDFEFSNLEFSWDEKPLEYSLRSNW